MVTFSSNDGEYNYLFVNFKVLKDYTGKLQENTVITAPISLAVKEKPANLPKLIEYYNSNNVSTSQANRNRMYNKRYATSQDIPTTSVGNPPTQNKENVNINIEKVENFLNENDSFVVYIHLLVENEATNQQTTADETTVVFDSLTDILYFNNKNIYAVKDNAISQKQIVDICTEFGGLVGTNTYYNYDKFFYENIAFADFDKNIVEFLNKQANK